MQLNNPKSNTSNIIKQSEAAKKKARRRLIGSIFMLFTALIILLNVTTKVKPIPVSPKVIEIGNNNASTPVKTNSSSVIANIAASETIAAASQPVKTIASSTQVSASAPQSSGFKAGVVNDNAQQSTSNTTTTKATVMPKIISQTIGHKPTPEEILNGTASNSSPTTVFFIQIAASQDKNSLLEIQHNLANNGTKSFIQNTKNTNMYRLRVGPFKTKDAADQKLEQIQNSLN